MSVLVGNPEDQFSCFAVQIIVTQLIFVVNKFHGFVSMHSKIDHWSLQEYNVQYDILCGNLFLLILLSQ